MKDILSSKKIKHVADRTLLDVKFFEKAVECTPRGGLPNFFRKLENKENVTIGYFGGSITEQIGWRNLSTEYLQKLYPQANIEGINASIGGTASTLGVYRLEYDLLKHKPDLVFIEFAVNDWKTPTETLIKTFEGMIIKIWKDNPSCDICFAYTFSEGFMQNLVEGKFPLATASMEMVAHYYNIPTIHLGLEVIELFKSGKLEIKAPDAVMTQVEGDVLNTEATQRLTDDGKIAFSRDGVHPYPDTGHVLYNEAIIRSIPLLQAASTQAEPHEFYEAIDPENLSNAVMLPLTDGNLSGTWTELSVPQIDELHEKIAKRIPILMRGEVGATLSFKFKGSQVIIYDLVGPDCGALKVEVDGNTNIIKRFDAHCFYHRSACAILADGLDLNKIHDVKVTVLGDKIEKRGVLFDFLRNEFDENPAKYDDTRWYAATILINGELQK